MSYTFTAIVMAALTGAAFFVMWRAWQARARRGREILTQHSALSGEVIAHFPRATYVSTTPQGQPLVRAAVPGLAFKGYAEVTVRQDGVTIQVTGEAPVHLALSQLLGHTTASTRVGKAVERDGLALLVWQSGVNTLESSFRFLGSNDQQRFAEAVDALDLPEHAADTLSPAQTNTDTIQEEA